MRITTQALNARRSRKDIVQALMYCQPRLVCPSKLFFLIEGEMKTFHNKQKLKEFMTTNQHCRK
jgi:hypothetical protein